MSVSKHDLDQACERFEECWINLQTNNKSWLEVRVLASNGTKYLRIVKPIQLAAESDEVVHGEDHSQDEDEIVEEDHEILEQSVNDDYDLLIIYDIVHSPTYQVPVLYTAFQRPPGAKATSSTANFTPSLDDVYELLVPSPNLSQVKDVGVMGALSSTDHPVTGLPAYFVHPCRTVEVMRELFDQPQAGEAAEWEMYLLIWLGLVGGSVGLDVPVELAEHIMATT